MEPDEPRRDLIMVVDDDPDIARFVEVNLRLHGFDVVLAGDGEEALELIDQRRPDLAVIDLMMPRLGGLELTQRLRADPMTAVLPIIMLTAKSQTVDKVVGLTAGADDYIVKPFDTSELVARVATTTRTEPAGGVGATTVSLLPRSIRPRPQRRWGIRRRRLG